MIVKDKILLSFDLDNTLIDNEEGIVNSFNYALKKFYLPKIRRYEIISMIGIPLDEMFRRKTKLEPSNLSNAFREYYSKEGIFQAKLLRGVSKKLNELASEGFKLGIITSKKQELAEKLVENLQIRQYFEYIIGETEERRQLGKLDPSIKSELNIKYPNQQIIVIGDHPKDVLLSNNLDCPFIGVLTGHFSSNQLREYKKDRIIVIKNIEKLNWKVIKSIIEQ